jgi:hypothetical protein
MHRPSLFSVALGCCSTSLAEAAASSERLQREACADDMNAHACR